MHPVFVSPSLAAPILLLIIMTPSLNDDQGNNIYTTPHQRVEGVESKSNTNLQIPSVRVW